MNISFRRIKINFPADLTRTYIDEIAIVDGNQTVHRMIEMALGSYSGIFYLLPNLELIHHCIGRSIRVDIASDSGAFSGSLSIEPQELLSPVGMSEDSFNAMKQRLSGGFTEASRELTLSNLTMNDVSKGIRSLLNVVEITKTSTSSKFCGCLRRGMSEDYVLISCSWKGALSSGSMTLQLVLNCSDAVLCATLVDFVKKNMLQSIDAL